jgi:hypothetical protein
VTDISPPGIAVEEQISKEIHGPVAALFVFNGCDPWKMQGPWTIRDYFTEKRRDEVETG